MFTLNTEMNCCVQYIGVLFKPFNKGRVRKPIDTQIIKDVLLGKLNKVIELRVSYDEDNKELYVGYLGTDNDFTHEIILNKVYELDFKVEHYKIVEKIVHLKYDLDITDNLEIDIRNDNECTNGHYFPKACQHKCKNDYFLKQVKDENSKESNQYENS